MLLPQNQKRIQGRERCKCQDLVAVAEKYHEKNSWDDSVWQAGKAIIQYFRTESQNSRQNVFEKKGHLL